MVALSNRNDIASISSSVCSKLYGLKILNNNIQNNENNHTRFICISKDFNIYNGSDKISLMFTVPHKSGSLYSVLSKFYVLGINLNKLESRPIPGKDFEFRFYIDFDGNIEEKVIQDLITQLEISCEEFTFLGAYKEK